MFILQMTQHNIEDMESVSEAINSGMMISLDLGNNGVIEDEEMHVVELRCDTENIVMDSVSLPDAEENVLADVDTFTELKSHCRSGGDQIITLWHVNSDLEFEVFIEA